MKGEKWMTVKNFFAKGLNKTTIANITGVSRKTVYNYLKAEEKPKYTLKQKKKSMLDNFRDKIDLLLNENPYTATRIFEIIKEQGFEGQIGIVKTYVSSKKKELTKRATLRFETLPGMQSQVDWGSFGSFVDVDGKIKKLYCFCIILGYSRMRYVEFTTSMKTEIFLKCHQNAFDYFGGHTNEILYDNMKQVVIKRLLKQSDSKFNPTFEDFSGFYGIKPILCRPYRPQTKGKIENTVKYVKYNFFMGIDFNSLDDLNKQALKWCEKVNNKIHGTTFEKPYDQLGNENLANINRHYVIPDRIIRKVDKTSLVNFKTNKYSVPIDYVGKQVDLELIDNILKFKYKNNDIAEHKLINSKHKIEMKTEHYQELLDRYNFDLKDNTLFKNSIHICADPLKINENDLSKYDIHFDGGKYDN